MYISFFITCLYYFDIRMKSPTLNVRFALICTFYYILHSFTTFFVHVDANDLRHFSSIINTVERPSNNSVDLSRLKTAQNPPDNHIPSIVELRTRSLSCGRNVNCCVSKQGVWTMELEMVSGAHQQPMRWWPPWATPIWTGY